MKHFSTLSFLRITVLCSLLCLGLQKALAQQIQLQGTVRDALTQQALIGATISLLYTESGTFTKSDGSFSLYIPVSTEKITLRISLSAYQRLDTLLSPDQLTLPLDLLLFPQEYNADDVVITAARGYEQRQADVPVTIEVIKSEAINLQSTTDIGDALRQVPGVNILDEQINIRGSSGFAFGVGSRVMLLLNGIPLLTSDSRTAELRIIPLDNIARVEVVKGSSSVLYGSGALGGVINIITAEPGDKPRTRLRFRQGFYDQPKFRAIDWDGSSSAFETSLHLLHSRKIGNLDLTIQTDLIKDSGYRQGTDREEFRSMIMANYKPKSVPGLSLGFNANVQIDSNGVANFWSRYFPDTVAIPVNNGQDTLNQRVLGALVPTLNSGGLRKRIRYRYAVSPFVRYLTPKGDLFWYRGRYFRNRSDNDSQQSSDNYLIFNDFTYQTTLLKKINWISGLTLTHSQVDGEEVYGGQVVVGNDTLFSDGRFTSSSIGIYSQLDAKFGGLTASLGLRYESFQIDTLERESKPLFRAGLNYEIARGTNVRASFGQGFRVPSIAERFVSTDGGGVVTEPNPDLLTESGFSAELGIRQGFRLGGPKGRFGGYLDLSGFWMQFDNMIEFSAVQRNFFPVLDVRFSSVNIAEARIRGVELNYGFFGKWNKWKLDFTGGATFTEPLDLNAVDPEFQQDLSDLNLIDYLDPNKVDQPRILKYRTRWLVRSSASLSYEAFTFTTNFRFRSFIETIDQFLFLNVPDLNTFRERYPNGDDVFDFIFTYRINEQNTISMNARNVFNEEYMTTPGTLAEQRKFILQYIVNF